MNYPMYSVLSAVYIKDNPEFLRISIESVLSQTVKTDDFIIVKDGKITDELEMVLSEYQSRYSFIHIYGYEKNHGLGYACNFGLQKTKHELVARMDSDDISLPERCERQLTAFVEDPKLDIVGTSIYEFSGDSNNIVSIKNMPSTEKEISRYARRRNPFNHPTVMYKKSSVIAHGGYREGKRGEDIALFTKMIFEGCRGKNLNERLFLYRADANQYKRRTSKLDSMAVIDVAKNNFHSHYISFWDYSFVVFAQCAGMIIPSSLGSYVFRKLFRSNKQ